MVVLRNFNYKRGRVVLSERIFALSCDKLVEAELLGFFMKFLMFKNFHLY